MLQAIKEANDIKRMREAIVRTNSDHLVRDYTKAIKRKTKALTEYCKYKDINIKEIL